MAIDLAGQTALVTGGGKRVGRAVCEALAQRGVRVAVHFHTSEREAGACAAHLKQSGVEAAVFRADLSDPAERTRLTETVMREFGPLDILVNSASIFPEDRLHEIDSGSLLQNFEINTLAPLDLSRAFAAQQRSGCIVNLLDTRIHDFDATHVSYHLSKRALFSLTRMMAVEFAPSVRVNAVAPGLVLPPAGKDEAYLESLHHTNPLVTHGNANDVAEAVVFLLQSFFVTGQVIYVDGGRHMRSYFYG